MVSITIILDECLTQPVNSPPSPARLFPTLLAPFPISRLLAMANSILTHYAASILLFTHLALHSSWCCPSRCIAVYWFHTSCFFTEQLVVQYDNIISWYSAVSTSILNRFAFSGSLLLETESLEYEAIGKLPREAVLGRLFRESGVGGRRSLIIFVEACLSVNSRMSNSWCFFWCTSLCLASSQPPILTTYDQLHQALRIFLV